jgi:hypothetical protein
VLNTNQVTVLLFGSRPTAHRHLAELHRAGLVERFVFARDRAHLLHHRPTRRGVDALTAQLERAGRPVPYGLADRGQRVNDVLPVNQFFTDLVVGGTNAGGHLYRWWHGLDAAAWLRTHKVDAAACDGFGLWIEQGIAVRFLFYLDRAVAERTELIEPGGAPARSTSEPPLRTILGTCDSANAGLPVDAITLLTEREDALREVLDQLELSVTIATTTPVLLKATEDGPAGPVWRTGPTPVRQRLIGLSHPPASPNTARIDVSHGSHTGLSVDNSIVPSDELLANWPEDPWPGHRGDRDHDR